MNDFLVDSPWGLVSLFAFLVFGAPAVLSDKAAEKFGALGALARWWRRRKEKALQEADELQARIIEDLRAEIRRVDEARQRDMQILSEEIESLRVREESQHSYILWVTDLTRKREAWAAAKGLEFPPPEFKTFPQWAEEKSKRKR